MDHEKLAMEVRNSGLLAPEELTDLFAHCLSHGKLETKFPSKARSLPQIRTPGGTTTTPKYTSTPSPHTTSSQPREVPRYLLNSNQKNSRHSSMTKSTSRSLTDSHKTSVDSNSHKNSHDGSHKGSHDAQEGLPKIDGEPGGDLSTSRLHQQEGDIVFNKDLAPSAPRRARSVVPTANKPRYSH